jgi:hypothetical protein
MNLLFTAPISRPTIYGGGTISGVSFTRVSIDPDALTATATFWAIEDGPLSPRGAPITVTITGGETMTQLLAAFKAAIATALGVTFQ